MRSFPTVTPLPPIAGAIPDGFRPIITLMHSSAFCHIRRIGSVVSLRVRENVMRVQFLDGEFVRVQEAARFLTNILPISNLKNHGGCMLPFPLLLLFGFLLKITHEISIFNILLILRIPSDVLIP